VTIILKGGEGKRVLLILIRAVAVSPANWQHFYKAALLKMKYLNSVSFGFPAIVVCGACFHTRRPRDNLISTVIQLDPKP
jgi:hypothetical protein